MCLLSIIIISIKKDCFYRNLVSNPGIVLMEGLCSIAKRIPKNAVNGLQLFVLFYHCTAGIYHPVSLFALPPSVSANEFKIWRIKNTVFLCQLEKVSIFNCVWVNWRPVITVYIFRRAKEHKKNHVLVVSVGVNQGYYYSYLQYNPIKLM